MLPYDFPPSLSAETFTMSRETAKKISGPFFQASLFPYLAFLYFLNVKENDCPKGVVVGFATCLLFVFLTILASALAQIKFGVGLADCDWLHGSAESMLTITNLVTVIAFRQALSAKESGGPMPKSAESYAPMTWLVVCLTLLAVVTAMSTAITGAEVHTPYLNGVMDLPKDIFTWGHEEPENALTIACWIIHISSLVEFPLAMEYAWRWSDVSSNPKWKGLAWGLIPLQSSGITACVNHLFYNRIPLLSPLQGFLTFTGNTTAAFAAYKIAVSNGWNFPWVETTEKCKMTYTKKEKEESLGKVLANDNHTFLLKLFAGCAIASYVIKYGELFFDFPFEANVFDALSIILILTALNTFKWYERSFDPKFKGGK